MKKVSPSLRSGASPMEEAKTEFLSRAIPFMLAKFYKAEKFGIDWRHIPLEHLDFHIGAAEDFASPPAEVVE